MPIQIGNAPVSFGIFEPAFGSNHQLPYPRVLEIIAQAGYEGTELGPYGYLPVEGQELNRVLREVNLTLASSFVPVCLSDPKSLSSAIEEVLKVGRLLATQKVQEVIVADTGNNARITGAGRSPDGWTGQEWQMVAQHLEMLSRTLWDQLRMRLVVHHHAGTHIETPEEIETLLAVSDPERVNLLLDTGHYVYGGGDPLDLVQRHPHRVRYVHYKDVDLEKLAWVRKEKMDLPTAWRQGVFVPLGAGIVNFPELTDALRQADYQGWIIVEQDTIPDSRGQFLSDPFHAATESRNYLRGLGL